VKDDKPTLAEAGIDKHLADRARKLAAIPDKHFEGFVGAWRTRAKRETERVTTDLIRPTAGRHAVHFSSESPEHYTPALLLDAVRQVMGSIDLDPCSNSLKRPNVPARRHYTAAEDGLRHPWSGRVFLNPPYGRELAPWILKVREEWTSGKVRELVALLPARTDTEWFNVLTRDTDDLVVCFLFGRLTFVGNTDPAPFPSMVGYFGPKHDRFARVFSPLGSLWQRPGSPLECFVDHS
jgi:DNA N-6-adenine-methyltransferase (Dam).